MRNLMMVASVILATLTAHAEEYRVTQLRAAPGNLPELLAIMSETPWNNLPGGRPVIMRHSQGNHWDLMLLGKPRGACLSKSCADTADMLQSKIDALVDFELSFIATSETTWDELGALNASTGLYHIEMFQAGAGKHKALMRQRVIENDFIERIGQKPNVIFDVSFGSDFDVFTVGFYPNLQVYAKPANVTQEQSEAAAIAAGFKNRADVSFHLRELIVGHQDTLAVAVK